MEGNIDAGAFDSATKLSQFIIEESADNGVGQISGNSFSKLRHLQTVKLGKSDSCLHKYYIVIYVIPGNNFAHLKSTSFSNLTALTTLEFSPNTLQTIEEGAFSFLPSLKILDLRFEFS